jgi:hypothetical protein
MLLQMNSHESAVGILFAGVRLIAIALLLTGLLGLVFSLSESWYHFDPNYLRAFLLATCFRPAVFGLTGWTLYLLAKPLASIAARPLRTSGK